MAILLIKYICFRTSVNTESKNKQKMLWLNSKTNSKFEGKH